MKNINIKKDVVSIISSVFEIKQESVGLDTSWEDQDIDSFALVELIVGIQDHFDIHFESSELEGLSTANELMKVVEAKLK